jgi:predicted dehydrogenase
MTLRIGVLGASRIAELAVVEPAAELGYRLVAVAARNRDRAALFAEKHGVERVLDSYDDVVADSDVDMVYNPLANALHAPWTLAAVRAGKPVLVEKPFARNRDEAQRVHLAVEAAGGIALEGVHYLFHPVTQRMLRLITDGTIGELRHIEVLMTMPAPALDDPRWSLDLAGGAMMDLGCYGLHIMRTVGAAISAAPQITAASAVQRSPGIDEIFDVEIGFGPATAGGATGRARHSMVSDAFRFTIRADGSAGEVLVHNFVKPHTDDRLTIRTPAGTRVERLGTRSSYSYQLEAFADRVRHGTALPIGTGDAVQNMEVIDEAYRAAGMQPR